MPEQIFWGFVLLAPPIATVSAILVGARMLRSHERQILALGVVLAFVTFMSGCFAITPIGNDDARLIIRNESSWPIEVSAEQPSGTRVVAPRETTQLVGYGGPGWANGLVINPEIRAGPDGAIVLGLTGLTGEELTIVVTNNGLVSTGAPR